MADINNSIIFDPIHLTAILARLEKSHCPLEVKKFSSGKTVQSLGLSEILHINHNKNNILFDTLEHKNIVKGQQLRIFTKHDGIEMNFTTQVTTLTERNHLIYFNTQIPTQIIYKQRRQQYRVELQNLWKIPVTLLTKNDPLTAYIYNISTGGINVRSATDNLSTIKKDTIIDTLIQLPNTENIQCRLQVRQIKSDQKTGLQQLAGKFIHLTPKQERNIRSFVNSVERGKIKTTTDQYAEYN